MKMWKETIPSKIRTHSQSISRQTRYHYATRYWDNIAGWRPYVMIGETFKDNQCLKTSTKLVLSPLRKLQSPNLIYIALHKSNITILFSVPHIPSHTNTHWGQNPEKNEHWISIRTHFWLLLLEDRYQIAKRASLLYWNNHL